MLNAVEIGPGYALQGAGGLGLVEIDPAFTVDGLGAYDDVSLVGAGMGAYDDVTLVGAFGEDLRPWYKRPYVLGLIAAGVVGAGTGAYFLLR